MEIIFETTRQFQKDLASFSKEDRNRIAANIDRYGRLVADGGSAPAHISPQRLPKGTTEYDSSLYVLRPTPRIRVILAIDEDPLFNRTVVTLFRAVKHEDYTRALRTIAESIHRQLYGGRAEKFS